jgi:hypothetical protein
LAASSYASISDLALYLPDPSSSANTTIWNVLLSMASRFIESQFGQYFYADGQSTKSFDGEGTSEFFTGQHPFYGKVGTIGAISGGATSVVFTSLNGVAPVNGDVLYVDAANLAEALTINGAVTGTGPYTCPIAASSFAHVAGTPASTIQVTLAYFENQPIAQWTATLAGNGITPGTNYWLWPRNRQTAGSTANPAALRPWSGIDIAHIPVSATSFLPGSIPGYATVAINAQWGWPAVPDLIKDLCCKVAARAWKARASGWTNVTGSADIGLVQRLMHFDPVDEAVLLASDLRMTYL